MSCGKEEMHAVSWQYQQLKVHLPNFLKTLQLTFYPRWMTGRNNVLQCKPLCHIWIIFKLCNIHRTKCT